MPAHSARPANRLRKHNKSFTGCWTCRARKVKCGEQHPSCMQCVNRGVPCGGYTIRLNWMTPETGFGDERQTLSDEVTQPTMCSRSQIVSGNLHPFPKQILKSIVFYQTIERVANRKDPPLVYQVDEILVAIDSLNPDELHSQSNNPSSNFIGGFGVFDSSENACGYHAGYARELPPTSHATTSYEAIQPLTPLAEQQNVEIGEASVTEAIVNDAEPAIPQGSNETHFVYPFTQIAQITQGDGETRSQQTPQLDSINPADNTLDHFQRLDFPNTVYSPIIPQPLSPKYLSPNEHLLLQYYTTRVVHIFPALDSPKSPWVTFHLPRVLQSVGEMAVRGTTSQVRAALRSTLLSISAFFLSKHMRSQSRSEESTKWETEAMHFHGAAMNLLKSAVTAKFTSHERPKYKELLATMLSMVSINVMSGDISSCGLHLQAAAKLITETAKSKSHYSTRCAALHRIYFYLSTIYDSTATCVPGSSTEAQETSNVESPLSNECAAIDGSKIPTSPRAGFYNTKHAGGYESIYAIPKDLLVFLSQTTELINLTSEVREKSGSPHIPFALAERCDELETRIMDWQADPIPADATSSPIANPSIIYNMTHAFHKAIIIFFAQHIRLMGHRYLRHYVEDVIDSIEEVERIKVEWQVSASPLYWPAFIAASEAFDLRLQDRFKSWYAQVEPNAIGSMNTGISLLQHVWAEGPSTGVHLTSLWRHIAMRTGTLLMLN